MTREEALSILKTFRITGDKAHEAFDMAIKALETPPNDNWEGYSKRLWKNAYERGKADAEQRWIPVSERLPDIPDGEDWVRCLCYGEKEITPDHVDDSNTITSIEIVTYFRRYGWDGWFHPIKWMPLPEQPYKAESEGV